MNKDQLPLPFGSTSAFVRPEIPEHLQLRLFTPPAPKTYVQSRLAKVAALIQEAREQLDLTDLTRGQDSVVNLLEIAQELAESP